MGRQRRKSVATKINAARSGEKIELRSEYYQDLAIEYAGGSFPIKCYFCPEMVVGFGHENNGAAHHVDHDHTNHVRGNLVVTHFSCHQRYHGSQPRNSPKSLSESHRLAIGRSVRGIVHTPAARANMAAGARKRYQDPEQREMTGRKFRGKPKTNEHRRKLAEASAKRYPCETCGRSFTKSWLKRHPCSGGDQNPDIPPVL